MYLYLYLDQESKNLYHNFYMSNNHNILECKPILIYSILFNLFKYFNFE